MTAKIKGYLIGAGAIVLAVIAALILYGNAQKRAYIEAKGASAVLTKQFNDYKASADQQIATLALEYNRASAEKDAALARATVAENAQVAIQSDLIAEKAKTAALPPDALSGNINLRIGANQSWPTAGGVFTFTRPGAESVLDRFLEGEADASKYQAERLVSTNLRAAIDAAERQSVSLGQRLTLTAGERDKALAAWASDKDALKHLERSILGTKIKTFAAGAGAGAVTVIVLHLLKVI